MKYLPYSLILSVAFMAYWLVKDMPWFIAFKAWVKKFLYRCADLFTNFVARVNDDVELY